jgi:hypothetical protein
MRCRMSRTRARARADSGGHKHLLRVAGEKVKPKLAKARQCVRRQCDGMIASRGGSSLDDRQAGCVIASCVARESSSPSTMPRQSQASEAPQSNQPWDRLASPRSRLALPLALRIATPATSPRGSRPSRNAVSHGWTGCRPSRNADAQQRKKITRVDCRVCRHPPLFACGVPRYGNSLRVSVWGLRPVGGHSPLVRKAMR